MEFPLLDDELVIDANGILEVNDLNLGNYVLFYYPIEIYPVKKPFQINGKKTTELTIVID